MTIMPFEGLMSESVEDVFGIPFATGADESEVTAADESWYCAWVVSGEAAQFEQDMADWAEETHDPDVPWS